MGRIIVTEHVTLDGVVEDNGGVEGFGRGGWQFQFDSGEDGGAFKLQEMRNSTALLLGRVTYDAIRAVLAVGAGRARRPAQRPAQIRRLVDA